ncbi:ATP-binding protein [Parachitinimonas caeni]|uniref:histidine kinase n=1 Tax=Parachitinimonas caeni TaxID=3031301 RepID=A0ABT7E141_9NEIS|nr:ATP-binding protein [Parachitinimonas caeni]MDK2126036.1 PAS domain-containing protein [Parachitinimonas caeni]
MAAHAGYRPPLPIYVPLLVAFTVLLVLFLFGLNEQSQLVNSSVEANVRQREQIARLVSDAMAQDLGQAMQSVERFSTELERQLEPPLPDSAAAFSQQFVRFPDGAIRSRTDQYNPARQAGVVLPRSLVPTPALQAFFVEASHYTTLYGLGSQGKRFVNSWILPKTGGEVVFWPDEPRFIYEAAPDFDYRATEWFAPTQPERNPQRKAYWTKLTYDPIPKVWMLSAVAPLYWRGEWFGSVGHDLPLANLLASTELLRQQEGSRFILLTADDVVAASDLYASQIINAKGELRLNQLADKDWANVVAQARRQSLAEGQQLRIRLADQVAFVSRIRGSGWWLVNLVPLAPIVDRIDESFEKLRNIAVLTLLLELAATIAILAWLHWRNRQHFNEMLVLQEDLAAREERFRSLVANIPGIVYRCANDAEWTMHYLSPAVQRMTGYPAEDFIGNRIRSFASIIHPDDQAKVTAGVEAGLNGHQPYQIEYRLVRTDGQLCWVQEQGQGIYDSQGRLIWLDGVIMDITALHEAQSQLRTLNLELEHQVASRTQALSEALRDLENFGHVVAHDLRAPLRHASGFLEIFEESLPPDPSPEQLEQRKPLKRAQQALERMNQMIQALWSVARLGHGALKPSSFPLAPLVNEVATELTTGTRVEVRVGELPRVYADRVLIREVIQNLLENAIKYSSKVGQPQISILNRSQPASGEVVIEIHDNGAGFDPALADRLFIPFQRLHSSEDFPGTGIGLALCARILALHGGHIRAESQPGEGASFYVYLPAHAPEPAHGDD